MNMRQGPNNKRSRGRGRGKHHGGGGGGPRTGGGGQDQVFNIHRTIDSNGPDVKIRGNAHHVYEKYLQLARDANSSGDRIMAENYLQHAEHYYRLIMAFQATQQQQQGGAAQVGGQPYGNGGGQPQPQAQPQAQAGNYNGGGRHPNGTGPQPGTEANGNTAEGNGEAAAAGAPYRNEDSGRYD